MVVVCQKPFHWQFANLRFRVEFVNSIIKVMCILIKACKNTGKKTPKFLNFDEELIQGIPY
jgi:hypothetical protein